MECFCPLINNHMLHRICLKLLTKFVSLFFCFIDGITDAQLDFFLNMKFIPAPSNQCSWWVHNFFSIFDSDKGKARGKETWRIDWYMQTKKPSIEYAPLQVLFYVDLIYLFISSLNPFPGTEQPIKYVPRTTIGLSITGTKLTSTDNM